MLTCDITVLIRVEHGERHDLQQLLVHVEHVRWRLFVRHEPHVADASLCLVDVGEVLFRSQMQSALLRQDVRRHFRHDFLVDQRQICADTSDQPTLASTTTSSVNVNTILKRCLNGKQYNNAPSVEPVEHECAGLRLPIESLLSLQTQ
jgi:hypothetical protein